MYQDEELDALKEAIFHEEEYWYDKMSTIENWIKEIPDDIYTNSHLSVYYKLMTEAND